MEKNSIRAFCWITLGLCLAFGSPVFADATVTNILTKVGTYNPDFGLNGFASKVQVRGKYAYISGATGLQIVDVSNPTNCVRVGGYATTGRVSGFALKDNLAYLADGQLEIVDIRDPSNCVRVGVYSSQYGANGVAVSDDYAYVTGHNSTKVEGGSLQIVDVRDPSNCALVGSLGNRLRVSGGSGVVIIGHFAYMIDDSDPSTISSPGSVYIVDIANPANPVGVTSIPANYQSGFDFAVTGNYAFIPHQITGMWVWDVSNPALPLQVGSYGGAVPIGIPWDIEVAGNYAYMACDTTGLHVIDISDPTKCVGAGIYRTAVSPAWSKARGVSVAGDFVYALDIESGLQIYQISTKPVIPVAHGASATAQVVNGFVVGVTLIDPGYGYTNAPSVVISGGGAGALAHAVVSNGVITQIIVDNAGNGYSSPLVQIAPPWTDTAPTLKIDVSKVKVGMSVTPGYYYQLEASHNMFDWAQAGSLFLATETNIVQEFDVTETGRFFRLKQSK